MVKRKTASMFLGLVGLLPTGLFVYWVAHQTANAYEHAIEQEYVECHQQNICEMQLQCEINISKVKQHYISELNSGAGIVYKAAGFPKILIGYPEGAVDQFLIASCEQQRQ